MKSKIVLPFAVLSMLFGIAIVGCHNNDTDDGSAADQSKTVDVPVQHDTLMAVKDSTTVAMNSGTAKPDAGKKGKKGKVAISESNMSKATGKMEADNNGVYGNVEVMPSFPGGFKGLQHFFDDNLQYPETASSEGVEGTVNISFVVDEKGKLTSPEIVGERQGYGLDEEALRVVKKMPAWNPGRLKGNNVKTKFTLPVKFVLY